MYTFKKQRKSNAAIPLAVLVGAALGSAIGILFAPQKGSKSRKWVKNKADDLKSIFGNTCTDSFNDDNSVQSSSTENKTEDSSVVTMHATTVAASDDSSTSKAAAMVNHLKHTKQENNSLAEPQ